MLLCSILFVVVVVVTGGSYPFVDVTSLSSQEAACLLLSHDLVGKDNEKDKRCCYMTSFVVSVGVAGGSLPVVVWLCCCLGTMRKGHSLLVGEVSEELFVLSEGMQPSFFVTGHGFVVVGRQMWKDQQKVMLGDFNCIMLCCVMLCCVVVVVITFVGVEEAALFCCDGTLLLSGTCSILCCRRRRQPSFCCHGTLLEKTMKKMLLCSILCWWCCRHGRLCVVRGHLMAMCTQSVLCISNVNLCRRIMRELLTINQSSCG